MRRYYRICRLIAHALFLLFFRGRIFGTRNVPREGGVLLVCNHQSFLDPVLATLAPPRECHYMARDTLFRRALFRRLIESLNAFPIKRGAADVGAIKETLRRLKRGALVTTFPEGTRTRDGSVGPMQPGVVLIARKAGVPLVPTLILGAYEAWPRHASLPRPKPVIIAYGQPLWPHQMKGLPDEACINVVRERIVAMMRRYRRHPALAGRLKPLPTTAAPPVAADQGDTS
jgi:1-acyl-sn-glycerol-3-phosphate acyltransferase